MKNKLFILLLIPVLVLTLTACTKKEGNTTNEKKLELVDSNYGTTTFIIDDTYTEIEESKGGASTELEFENETLDLDYDMYYTTMRKASYNTSKETRSKQKYYKEYKFGNYEGYAYGEYTSSMNLNIILSEDGEDYTVLFVSIDRHDSNEKKIVSDIIAEKETQSFLNSIKYEK